MPAPSPHTRQRRLLAWAAAAFCLAAAAALLAPASAPAHQAKDPPKGAQAGDREFFGHYFELEDAQRVADRINKGDAPGWTDAWFEKTPHPVTKTYGVYARRYDPRLPKDSKAALAVTITWNTKTDVDLWVTEPGGEKVYYAHRDSKIGGKLHEDNTSGFGPEHYTLVKPAPGEYVVEVHMYSTHSDKAVPTIVTIEVTRNAGTPQETHQTYSATLRNSKDVIEVCRIKY